MPIAAQYTYLGVEISKECSWDAHVAKVIGQGKAHVGKMDAILIDSHLDTRIKRCSLLNVIVPKLECAGEVWEGNAKLIKQLETVQMTALKKYKDAQVRRVIQYQEQNWECTHLK